MAHLYFKLILLLIVLAAFGAMIYLFPEKDTKESAYDSGIPENWRSI